MSKTLDNPAALRLLALARGGDRVAFGDLYVAYGDRVLAACRRKLGRGADADDFAQDVWLAAMDRVLWDEVRNVAGWLTKVCVGVAYEAYRVRSRAARDELTSNEFETVRAASADRPDLRAAAAAWRAGTLPDPAVRDALVRYLPPAARYKPAPAHVEFADGFDPAAADPDPADAAEARELAAAVRAAVAGQPADVRDALAGVLAGRTFAEMEGAAGVPASTLKSRAQRGYAAVRGILAEVGD